MTNAMTNVWAILTGEYPPDPGGVSDYTRRIATELAKHGDEVHVFASPVRSGATEVSVEPGIVIHRLTDSFGPRGLSRIGRDLEKLPDSTRVLVQYVPHAFGYRAMNLGLCAWLATQQNRAIEVMFHEVAAPIIPGQPLKLNLLGIVHRAMAFALVRSASRVLVSTSAWEPLLRPMMRKSQQIEFLPVPTNLPTSADAAAMREIRDRFAGSRSSILVGHFGTYGAVHRPLLCQTLLAALAGDDRVRILLMGRGAQQFLDHFSYPGGRVHAVIESDAQAVANHLAACDLLVQPYIDGVTTRRSSTMAGLALGVATLCTRGPSTEAIWESSRAVLLADNQSGAIAPAVKLLIDRPELRRSLAARGRALYREHFGVDQIISKLRSTTSRS